MSKNTLKKFPHGIDKCIKNAEIKVIKSRAHGKDTYTYEISADGTKPFLLESGMECKAGGDPAELEDAWCGGKWGNGKFKGCDFDINVMDRSEFGDPDDGAGLFASMYGCHPEDGEPHVNMDDSIDCVPVTCWFEEKDGKRTEFKCNDQENFLELFGKWDGKEVPKFNPTEMTVTCLVKFPAHFVTVAASKAEAKQAAVEALTKVYHEMGIEGEIEIIPGEVKRTTKKKV